MTLSTFTLITAALLSQYNPLNQRSNQASESPLGQDYDQTRLSSKAYTDYVSSSSVAPSQLTSSSSVTATQHITSSSVAAAQNPQTSSSPKDTLFSNIKEQPKPLLETGRQLLSFPGSIAELAFLPILPILNTLERYRIIERAFKLFTNDELTFAVLPIVEPFSQSGLGLGALSAWNSPLGGPDRIIFLGLARLNGDRQISLDLGRRIPFFSGRVINISIGYSVDKDINWFGLGADQGLREQRLIRMNELSSHVGLSELFPSTINIDGAFNIGFRRRGLFSGVGSQAPPFNVSEDISPGQGATVLRPPPGFGQTINYAEGNLLFRYDSRDGLGRTTRGLVWTLEGDASVEIPRNDGRTRSGGIRATSRLTWFIPILPRNRVFVLMAGLSSAAPITRDGEVALHQLVNLGGADTLRGYQPDRFIDRLGWWSSLEYRFLLSNYGGSLIGFSGTLFADVGRVSSNGSDLFTTNIPWSIGLGLRIETDFLLLGRLQLAFSPEGAQVSFGIGESF
ncbi:MAG: outer membrane protein assembly factor [Myxococcales bacterium]|nr:outer membrane protein assembly factor [Myxococcales bacterium]